MAYPDFLAQRRKLMGQVVKDAYARLKEHAYSPAYPAAEFSQAGDRPSGTRPGTSRSPSLT